jgi:hypothetical protein
VQIPETKDSSQKKEMRVSGEFDESTTDLVTGTHIFLNIFTNGTQYCIEKCHFERPIDIAITLWTNGASSEGSGVRTIAIGVALHPP